MLSTRIIRKIAGLLAIGSFVFVGIQTSLALEVDGFTEPYKDIDIAASEMGLLESVDVVEGSRVQAGQILAHLDEAVLRASLAIAKQTMESKGRIESATAELELQKEMASKLTSLRERGHASQQELDRAKSQLQIVDARLKSVREEYEVRALEFQRTQVQLEQRILKSPIAGVVTRVFKESGEFITVSDPVVMKVVQLDQLKVVFAIPSARARELTVGQPAIVKIADSAHPTTGAVEFVSPTADPQSGTTRVRVRIPNPDEKLPCGASCRLIMNDPAPADEAVAERSLKQP